MAKEKIVRCTVFKRDAGGGSVRYVPLEIYQLWKNLMSGRHGFEIGDECVSLWFDIDGDPNVTYADSNYEQVTRVSLRVYSEPDAMFREVTRYFPTQSYADIKPCFLSHYDGQFDRGRYAARIEETRGVWLKRDDQ